MRKCLIISFVTLLFCSCGTSKLAQQTIGQTAWVNVSPSSPSETSEAVVMTLFFTNNTDVTIMTSVKSGSETVVKPFVYAFGNYTVESLSKKHKKIKITAKDITGKDLLFSGEFQKDAMILVSADNTPYAFGRVNNIKFE